MKIVNYMFQEKQFGTMEVGEIKILYNKSYSVFEFTKIMGGYYDRPGKIDEFLMLMIPEAENLLKFKPAVKVLIKEHLIMAMNKEQETPHMAQMKRLGVKKKNETTIEWPFIIAKFMKNYNYTLEQVNEMDINVFKALNEMLESVIAQESLNACDISDNTLIRQYDAKKYKELHEKYKKIVEKAIKKVVPKSYGWDQMKKWSKGGLKI